MNKILHKRVLSIVKGFRDLLYKSKVDDSSSLNKQRIERKKEEKRKQ